MTITATPSQIVYNGDGVSTVFAIPFVFDTPADLKVILTNTAGTPTVQVTGFAISGGGGSTGTCTFSVAPTSGYHVTILDNPELTQPVDYTDNDAFAAATHEGALDRSERQIKRLHQRVDRSIRVQDGDDSSGDALLLPVESARAGKFLAFDAGGQPIASTGTGGGDAALRTDLAGGISTGLVHQKALNYIRTAAELAALVNPTNFYVPPHANDAVRFGCDPTGVLDSSAALLAFIACGGGDLGINTTYKVNSALLVDAKTSCLYGDGVTFTCAGGGSLQAFSSAAFPELVNTTRDTLRGITLVGPNTLGSSGLILGRVGVPYQQSSQIRIRNCAVYQFGKLVECIDNSWRSSFDNCRFEQPASGGYFIYQGPAVANAGEVMTFDHCMFTDSTGEVFVNRGQWSFNDCSFGIACTLHGATSATIKCNGSHFEAQPNTGYVMLKLDDTANCCLLGGDIVINGPTVFAKNPIVLNGADTQLSIFGTYIPMNLGTFGRFENDTSKLRDWVVGTGRLYAAGLQTSGAATLAGIGNNCNFSKLCNKLSNGDAEYGNTNNWTIATFGSAGSTVTATAGSKLNGANGFNVATVPTGGVTARQTVNESCAGRLVILSAVHKVVTGTGTSGQLFLRFLDAAGATISSLAQNWLSTDTVFTYGPLVGYAPQGTQALQCEFNGQANAGAQQIFVDEVCLNIL